MEYAVKVGSIPAGLRFPDQLQKRIRFEADNQQLVFQGFMYKSDYDQLIRLSQDVSYQNAVAKLFQLSTDSDPPQMRKFGRILGGLTLVCLLLATIVWWSLLSNPVAGGSNSAPPDDGIPMRR